MTGGAVRNTVAFIGGNYLARYPSGDDQKAALEKEKKDTTKLSKLTKPLMPNTRKIERSCLITSKCSTKQKGLAKQNFRNTDYAFKLYNRMHQDEPLTAPSKPKFSDFYQPSALQKQGELIFVGTGALALGCAAFRFL